MPNDFIPVADETGIILSINRQLLPEACQQLLSWQQLFPSDPPLSLSVNVSPEAVRTGGSPRSDWPAPSGEWHGSWLRGS